MDKRGDISLRGLCVLTVSVLMVLSVAPPGAAAPPVRTSLTRISGPSPLPQDSEDAGGCGFDVNASLWDLARDVEVEPTLAASPSDPQNLVAVWLQDGGLAVMTSVSDDAGDSWTTAPLPGITSCTGGPRQYRTVYDVRVSIGPSSEEHPDGIVYVVATQQGQPFPDPRSADTRVVVSRSVDGGQTFSAPLVVAAGGNDFPTIAADSRQPGVAYLVWQNAPLLTAFSRTVDGGLTWSPARTIRLHPDELALNNVLVLPNSDLVITYQSFSTPEFIANGLQGGELGVFAIRSEDGGDSWSDPVSIGQNTEGIHASVVAPDGSVYVVWEQPEVEGRPGLVISNSSDGGLTWRPARLIDGVHSSAFLPAVTVTPSGTVGVLFNDLRNDQEGDGVTTADVLLLQSTDRGHTWEEVTLASSFSVEDGDWVTFAGGTPFETHNPYLGDHQSVVATECGLTAIFALGRPYAVHGSADMFVGTAATPSDLNREGCRHDRADPGKGSARGPGGF